MRKHQTSPDDFPQEKGKKFVTTWGHQKNPHCTPIPFIDYSLLKRDDVDEEEFPLAIERKNYCMFSDRRNRFSLEEEISYEMEEPEDEHEKDDEEEGPEILQNENPHFVPAPKMYHYTSPGAITVSTNIYSRSVHTHSVAEEDIEPRYRVRERSHKKKVPLCRKQKRK